MTQIFLTPENVDALSRVAYAEAANQGEQGLAGVVYTILNRLVSGRFGSSLDEVLNARNQFEPVTSAGGDWRNLRAPGPQQAGMLQSIVQRLAAGQMQDPTGGATFFQNPQVTSQRGTNFAGGATPTATIGAHSFYNRYKGGAPVGVPQYQVALSGVAPTPPPPSPDLPQIMEPAPELAAAFNVPSGDPLPQPLPVPRRQVDPLVEPQAPRPQQLANAFAPIQASLAPFIQDILRRRPDRLTRGS